jgi:formylglycine-generating enzyme required for sulfatase activity
MLTVKELGVGSKLGRHISGFLVALGALAKFFVLSASADSVVSYRLTDGRDVATFESFKECDLCPEMIVLPLGTFMMGATAEESRNPFDIYGKDATMRIRRPDEPNIIPSEHPRHPVEMDIPYAIGRNEITRTEWMFCVDDGGCSHNPDYFVFTARDGNVALGPNHPVVNVSYLDILEYVDWLNGRVGADVYRLPTEAEWEYAGRAGTETRFAQGDELTADQANFSRLATEHVQQPLTFPELVDRGLPIPVTELDATNSWGLRHMSGNVSELTLSCWAETHLGLATDSAYLASATSDADCVRYVAKGGDYGTAMDGLRLAKRNRPTSERRRSYLGFRIAREFKD